MFFKPPVSELGYGVSIKELMVEGNCCHECSFIHIYSADDDQQ